MVKQQYIDGRHSMITASVSPNVSPDLKTEVGSKGETVEMKASPITIPTVYGLSQSRKKVTASVVPNHGFDSSTI